MPYQSCGLDKKIHRKAMDFFAEGVGFDPTCLSANGFQVSEKYLKITENIRRYRKLNNAENPIKSRAFSVLLFQRHKNQANTKHLASKEISKKFLEKF